MKRLYIDGRWYSNIEQLETAEVEFLAQYCQESYERYRVHPDRQQVHVDGLRQRAEYVRSVLEQKKSLAAAA